MDGASRHINGDLQQVFKSFSLKKLPYGIFVVISRCETGLLFTPESRRFTKNLKNTNINRFT